jgi:ubiquinone/menaquinone biosynthesis C-methylase UbiE
VNPAALAYDRIAAGYDAQVQGDDWMRRVLHAHYARLFGPGQRVLDVGCGTGIDALFLAQRGVRVVAMDISEAMIGELRVKLATAAGAERIDARVLAVEDLGQLTDQRFDGLISAFAGLSALEDLHQFARDAAVLVRPGGRLVCHLLNRFSLWECLGYLSHADWHAARQVGRLRSREFTIGGRAVRHRLYFADELYRSVFAERFALRDAYALGSLRPPHTVRRLPGILVQHLERLDVRCGRWPLLRDAGRFCVLDLERRAA